MIVQRQFEDARTPADVQRITSFAGASDADRLRLIGIVLHQTWVGPYDEAALERIWGSLDEAGLVRFAEANPGLWEQCQERGADLTSIAPYRAIQARFRGDVTALALRHLAHNEELVHRELEAVGEGSPMGAAHQARVAAVQAAAESLANLQRAQEAAREARVGWRIGNGGEVDPEWEGRDVTYQVPFRPGEPPPLREQPPGPSGDLLRYPIVPYEEVQQRYDEASNMITRLVAAHPALFGFARGASSAATRSFADKDNPEEARERMVAPLRAVLADIATTRAALGGDLDPLDLTPLHDQLYGGGPWAAGFRRGVAQDAVRAHVFEAAAQRLALEVVQHYALLFAPFTSGVSLLLLLGTAAVAAGVRAYGSYREAETMAAAEGTAVAPGTELVRPGTAEFARMSAEADAVAFGLALLALGGAAFEAWRAGAPTRALRSQARALVRDARARGGPVTVNIGGAGAPHEPPGAINLNPQVPGTERLDVPNLVQAPGERLGELFPPNSVDSLVGFGLSPEAINWDAVVGGATRVLRPGATVDIGFRWPGSGATQLEAALRRAGFRDVTNVGNAWVRAVR